MENHNIDWLMGAVVVELVLIFWCGHFNTGYVSGGLVASGGVPTTGLGISTISWFFKAMTFQLGTGFGVALGVIFFFLDFVILWCVVPLIIAGVQALGTWIP